MNELELIREERKRLKEKFTSLFSTIGEILFRYDPIGINFGHNTDEYEPEVGTILPKLEDCHSVDDVHGIVYKEFIRWFGPENAGTADQYRAIAEEIWKVWQESNVFSK